MKKLMALVLSFAMVFSAVPVFGANTAAAGTTSIDTYHVEGYPQTVDYDGTAKTFSGLRVMPQITSGDSEVLVEGTSYTVKYDNNVNPGTATMTIEGTGKYTGKIVKAFTIKKAFTDEEVAAISAAMGEIKDYTVGEAFVSPEVKWNDIVLKKDVDYTVTADTSKAGEQTAVIKFIGAYSGKDITKAFKVVEPKNDFTKAQVFFSSTKGYAFTGAEVKPEVAVGFGANLLTEGKDYTVSYDKNTNAGKAEVIVKGIGDFDGEIRKEFTITAAEMKDVAVTLEKDAYTATGQQIKPAITSVKLGEYALTAADYNVSYGENKEIGEGTVTLTAADTGSGNFTGAVTVKFVIAAKTAEDFNITLETTEYKYDGLAHTPAVTVKDGETVLKADTDYTVAYENNTNAGTAKVIVTGKGLYTGSKTVEFKINGKKASIFTKANNFTKYVPTSKPFALGAYVKAADATGFTYKSLTPEVAAVDAEGTVTIVNSGVAKIQIDTVGTKAYNPITKIVTVTVKPLKPVFTLSSPAAGKLKATVTKEVGATRYEVRYGKSGVYKIKSITHKDTAFTKTSYTVSKLQRGKTYFVKVRAVKVMADGTEVYGNWSATKKIKVK